MAPMAMAPIITTKMIKPTHGGELWDAEGTPAPLRPCTGALLALDPAALVRLLTAALTPAPHYPCAK